MDKLTIGVVCYDDYDGLYFTIQSIRIYHPEILDRVEFVIINNNPSSPHGKEIHNFIDWIKEPITYLEFTKYSSPFLKGKIFDVTDTEYVLVVDSHVLLHPGSIKKLIDYYDAGKDNDNLLHGPLIYDDIAHVSTHFDLSIWSKHMWGQWATDDRGKDPESDPFEIPAQGMGLFSCRRSAWLGFNPLFRGFGGEEGYIHTKYRKAGKVAMCLPFLRWTHRFGRPDGVPHAATLDDRFRNYIIGFKENGQDIDIVIDEFKDSLGLEVIDKILVELDIA